MTLRIFRALACLALLAPALACVDRDLTGSYDQVVEGERPFSHGEQYAACEVGNDCADEWCLSPVDEPGFCTQACDPNDDPSAFCMDGPAGTAKAVCLEVGPDAACALDCGSDPCPAGMRCEQVVAQDVARSICF